MKIYYPTKNDRVQDLETAIKAARPGEIIFVVCEDGDAERYDFYNFWKSYSSAGNFSLLTDKEKLESKRAAICAWYAATGASITDLPRQLV
jgi:hypothetical protein